MKYLFAALLLPLSLLAAPRHNEGDYIITLNDTGTDPAVVARFHGVGPKKTYRTALKGFAAHLTGAQADKLEEDSRVLYFDVDEIASVNVTTTYYIDYVSGNDANNGTSKLTPWKHHPYMKTFTGAYAHSAGDRFIFKGGVTWPTTVFQMKILYGGTSELARDYYGVDTSWFTGATWARPIFDFQNQRVTNSIGQVDYERSAGVIFEGYGGSGVGPVAYITFDNFDVRNFQGSKGAPGYKSSAFLLRGQTHHITFQNCIIKDWNMPTITAPGDDPNNIGGITQGDAQVNISGCVIDNCEFTTSGASQKVGQAVHGYFTVQNSYFHDVCNAFLGSGVFKFNLVSNIVDATDTSAHENAVYTQAPSIVANNLIRNSVTGGIYASPGLTWTGTTYVLASNYGIDLIYNNVVFNIGSMAPIEIDEEGTNPNYVGSRVFNNTVEHGSGIGIRVNTKAILGYFEAKNNHIITSGTGISYNQAYISATVVLSNNLQQSGTVANGQGYNITSLFSPSAGGSTIDSGTTLATYFSNDYLNRSRTLTWDIGAYEYLASPSVTQTIPLGVKRIGTLSNLTAHISGQDINRVNVDVAIIDTGVDLTHPDLNIYRTFNYSTNSTANDGHGHGTHVAGIIGALDNNFGVVGVAPGVRLWIYKSLNDDGRGNTSSIIAAIDDIASRSADIEVANMSLGGQANIPSLRAAIAGAVAKGVIFVVAAGNDSFNIYGQDGVLGTTDDIYPAAYPEVATISALADSDGIAGGIGPTTSYGPDDSLATFSNYSTSVDSSNPVSSPGAAIDVAAPGVNIFSTYKNNSYSYLSGTSMACPHVAGAMALYVAQFGRATNAAGVYSIRQAIIDSAEPQTSWGVNPTTPYAIDKNPEGLVNVAHFGTPIYYPNIVLLYPSAGTTLRTTTTIQEIWKASASDNVDGDVSSNLFWVSSLQGSLGSGGTVTNFLVSGSHKVVVSVTNSAGLLGRASFYAEVTGSTLTPPVVTILTPTNGATYASTNDVPISATVSNYLGSGPNGIVWNSSIDGYLFTGNNYPWIRLSAGSHTITASYQDTTGLSDSDSVNITVTGTVVPPPPTNNPPIVSIEYPLEGSSFPYGTTLTATATASDLQDGNISTNITWTDNIDATNAVGASFTFSPSIGNHLLSAQVHDSAGAVATANRGFMIYATNTNTAPVVVILTPTNTASFTNGQTITFTGTSTDAEEGYIAPIWYSSLDGIFGSGTNFTYAALSTGTHTITSYATDTNGLAGVTNVTITITEPPPPPVENSAPTITIISPASGYTNTYGYSVTLTGAANDSEDGIISQYIIWSSSLSGYIGTGSSVSFRPGVGTHIITAKITDSGGLTTVTTRIITIYEPTQSLSIAITAPDYWKNNQKMNIVATVTSGTNNISGATVQFTITDSSGYSTTRGPSMQANGVYTLKYVAKRSRIDVGVGTIKVTATKAGYNAGVAYKNFTMQ